MKKLTPFGVVLVFGLIGLLTAPGPLQKAA